MRVSKKRTCRENMRRSVEIAMREYDGIIEHRRQKYLRQLKAIHRKRQNEKAAPERQFQLGGKQK